MTVQELAYFTDALGAFLKSASKFRVVCTVQSDNVTRLMPVRPLPPIQKLIILDSSFNPPTLAHMQMLTSAVRIIQNTHPVPCRLLLLLSVNNADKAPKPASFEQRLSLMFAMAKDLQRANEAQWNSVSPSSTPIDIALASEPYFHAKSEAIASSEFYAKSDLPEAPVLEAEQVFLVGYDTLIRIFDPKYYGPPGSASSEDSHATKMASMEVALAPFLNRARLLVTTRPDDQWGGEQDQMTWMQSLEARTGSKDWSEKIATDTEPQKQKTTISSTAARKAAHIKDWSKLESLVSPSVLSWVQSQGLYTD